MGAISGHTRRKGCCLVKNSARTSNKQASRLLLSLKPCKNKQEASLVAQTIGKDKDKQKERKERKKK